MERRWSFSLPQFCGLLFVVNLCFSFHSSKRCWLSNPRKRNVLGMRAGSDWQLSEGFLHSRQGGVLRPQGGPSWALLPSWGAE